MIVGVVVGGVVVVVIVIVIVVVDDVRGDRDGGVVVVAGVIDSDNRGIFGCVGRPNLLLQHTYHSSLESVWNRLCRSFGSSKKCSISVNSGISVHAFLITFGLFIVSYLFAFSSKSLGCFSA